MEHGIQITDRNFLQGENILTQLDEYNYVKAVDTHAKNYLMEKFQTYVPILIIIH